MLLFFAAIAIGLPDGSDAFSSQFCRASFPPAQRLWAVCLGRERTGRSMLTELRSTVDPMGASTDKTALASAGDGRRRGGGGGEGGGGGRSKTSVSASPQHAKLPYLSKFDSVEALVTAVDPVAAR